MACVSQLTTGRDEVKHMLRALSLMLCLPVYPLLSACLPGRILLSRPAAVRERERGEADKGKTTVGTLKDT